MIDDLVIYLVAAGDEADATCVFGELIQVKAILIERPCSRRP